MVVYWNYQSSTCRLPGSPASGGPGDGTLDEFSTGAVLRASSPTSDFALVELDDLPDPAFNLYWSGWNRTVTDATSAVTIHHPLGEEKRINFSDEAVQTTSNQGTTVPGDSTHIWVASWDIGSLQFGSSGAPLFDQDRRVVGQLHSSDATCAAGGSSWAGRLSASWDGSGTSTTRLRDWLDPASTGLVSLDGLNGCVRPSFDFTVDPNPAAPGQSVTFSVSDISGTGPFSFAWDLDGDDVTDCVTATCVHTYPGYFNRPVTLTVTDSLLCSGWLSHTMLVNAPHLVVSSAGPATELCGDGDVQVEPGEEWSVPVQVANAGTVPVQAATSQVSVAGSPAGIALTRERLVWGEVPPGATATATFDFLIDPAFSPCGEHLAFDLGPITWSDGASPGLQDAFATRVGGEEGLSSRYWEDFEDPETWGGDNYPGDDKWSVTSGPGPHTCGGWERNCTSGNCLAVVTGVSGCLTSSLLTSPTIDLGSTAPASISLEVDLLFPGGDTEHALVNVYDGSEWHTVADYFDHLVVGTQVFDVTSFALGNPSFRVQLSFQNSAGGSGFMGVSVQVTAPLPLCDNLVDYGRVPTIFADGFESGLTAAWSTALP